MTNPQNAKTKTTILSQWMRRWRSVVPCCVALVGLCVASMVYSASAAGNLNSGQDAPQEATPLELGKPVERELAGGQSHAYQVTLTEGQYLNVVVEQRGIDLAVRLLGPDGKLIFEFDSELRKQGQETMSQVAEVTGNYRLNVVAKEKNTPAERYEIRVAELRAATEKDRALQEARKLSAEFRRLYSAGKYDEARPLAERALELREKALGSEHSEVAQALYDLGLLHRSKGDYAKAESLLQQALSVWEKSLGPEHLNVADALNSLAILHRLKGDYTRAEQMYQRALVIREKTLGQEHQQVASTLANLAMLSDIKGDYTRAESFHLRALAIREKTLGPEHADVANSLNSLAILHRVRGDYAKAESLYWRALAIQEKTLGPEHLQFALTLTNLATLYRALSDYGKAEPLYQRVLAACRRTLFASNGINDLQIFGCL